MENIDFYKKWIANIGVDVKHKYCVGILEHIRKHVFADLQKHFDEEQKTGKTDWRTWSASMRNLLDIFDEVYLDGRPPTIDEQIARLQSHYERHPDKRTGPPKKE